MNQACHIHKFFYHCCHVSLLNLSFVLFLSFHWNCLPNMLSMKFSSQKDWQYWGTQIFLAPTNSFVSCVVESVVLNSSENGVWLNFFLSFSYCTFSDIYCEQQQKSWRDRVPLWLLESKLQSSNCESLCYAIQFSSTLSSHR